MLSKQKSNLAVIFAAMIKKILVGVLLLLPFTGFSQEDELGNWWIYFGNKELSDRWDLHHEVQYRNYNFIGDLEQLLIRGGVGYHLTENNNRILVGYGYINSENNPEDGGALISTDEHRIYQEFTTSHSIAMLKLSHRYRFEQRFVEDQDMKTRFRYFLAPTLPLTSDEDKNLQWYASAYNEIFLVPGDESLTFDRNRLYGGAGAEIKPGLKVEAGYMNQFFENGGRDQLNIILRYSF